MSVQFETLNPEQAQEQHNEIEDCASEIEETLKAAVDLLIERRDKAYAAAVAPLDAEIATLTEEYERIEETAANLEKLLPARARVSQHEADQFTLAGETEKAEAKLAEMRQAEDAPAAMRRRQAEITERLVAIEEERRNAARPVFNAWHKECKTVIRAVERGHFMRLLDGLWNEYLDFEARTCPRRTLNDVEMVGGGHRIDLTAEGQLWERGCFWYAGRRR